MGKYQTFLAAQSERNPSIQNVINFLGGEWRDRQSSRLVSLEFSSDTTSPKVCAIESDQLQRLLQPCEKLSSKGICGRILVIEDLTRDVVETLGSLLHLDPLFFASHIHSPWPDIFAQTPDMAMLPSRRRSDTFVNIHYHRTIILEDADLPMKQLLRRSNVHRKVVILPKIKGVRIGLAQHCCSIYRTTLQDNTWICMSTAFRNFIITDTFQASFWLTPPWVPRTSPSRGREKRHSTLTFVQRTFKGDMKTSWALNRHGTLAAFLAQVGSVSWTIWSTTGRDTNPVSLETSQPYST